VSPTDSSDASLADHDVGGLDHRGNAVRDLQAEVIDASFVMDDVTFTPWPRSTTTCAVVAPLWNSTTLP